MESRHVKRLVDAGADTARLLALDDVWTAALAAGVETGSASAIVSIGEDMRHILGRLRDEAPFLADIVLHDATAFESVAQDVLDVAPLSDAIREQITAAIDRWGWVASAELAFRDLADSEGVDQELARQIETLTSQGEAPGDLPRWMRVSLHVVQAALGIGVAVLTGSALPVLAMAVLAPVIQLGLDVDGLRQRGHGLSAAEEIEKFAKLRDRGRITEDQYQRAVEHLITAERRHDDQAERDALAADIADFSPALKRDLPAPRRLRLPKPTDTDSPQGNLPVTGYMCEHGYIMGDCPYGD